MLEEPETSQLNLVKVNHASYGGYSAHTWIYGMEIPFLRGSQDVPITLKLFKNKQTSKIST